ncbi:glycosyltransferase [Arthrobacter yangruifuii]
MPVAKIRRIPARYVESVSRVQGPSLTGRVIAALRLAETHTQHSNWASRRWIKHPSVLSQFSQATKTSYSEPVKKPSVFVTLGTIRPYRFDSLVDALLSTGLCNELTTWQLGHTNRSDLPGTVVDQISAEDFSRLCKESDIVVTHSGVGTILNLLEAGIHPVVVPRRKSRGEHVDDHQLQIAALVAELGIATVAEADALKAEHLLTASQLKTVPVRP